MNRTYLFFIFAFLFASCNISGEKDVISTAGRKVLLNEQTYLIKGVCYHPVPLGSDKRSFENLTEDLALMKEAGINTIRVYVPITEEGVLDEIHEAGIKVITGFGYNQQGKFDILSGTFSDYIEKHKEHPAILFWELGNEYNYHPDWFGGDIRNWYAALNEAAAIIKEIDPNHPASTAHGEMPDSLAFAMCSNIDVWGINIYRWDEPSLIFDEWKAASNKPMYFSEAGADSYMTIANHGYEQGINEKAQADAMANILDATFSNKELCSGVTLFAFVDEWWKAGNPNQLDTGGWAPNSSGVPYDGTPNEEYWGIVKIDRSKKAAFKVVKEKFHEH